MSDVDHYCGGCGVARKSFARYAWHFCNDCCDRAANRAGRVVECTNVSMSGGFQWKYIDGDEWAVCKGLYALISGRDVYLTEARFGGIVAQPLMSRHRAEELDGGYPNMDIRSEK